MSHYWQESGVEKGDCLLIHSSMARTFRQMKANERSTITPKDVVESLLDLVGKEGTILFPTFNFDFIKAGSFSINHTKSQMGVITEWARLNLPGIRTGHPIYSFFVVGKLCQEFANIDNESGYGADSPFAKLLELDGRVAVVDLEDQESMTFYHFVEEQFEVPYRYFKDFSGTYVNSFGDESFRTYRLFVRNLDKLVVTNVNPMGDLLWRKGAYVGNKPFSRNGMRSIKARTLYSEVSAVIQSGLADKFLFNYGTNV